MTDKRKAPEEAIKSKSTDTKAKSKPIIKVIKATGEMIVVSGREAQALWHLMQVKGQGATSLDFSRAGWARRTSAYIFDLRMMGIAIVSPLEATDDGARVARYILAEPLTIQAVQGLGGDA